MYSEALNEKVARAIRKAYAEATADDHEEWVGPVSEWLGEAIAALDALGLREELGTSALTDGRIIRYVTAWEYS